MPGIVGDDPPGSIQRGHVIAGARVVRVHRGVLLQPSDRVLRVLQITRLVKVFEIFDDEDQAVDSFAMPSLLPQIAREAIASA